MAAEGVVGNSNPAWMGGSSFALRVYGKKPATNSKFEIHYSSPSRPVLVSRPGKPWDKRCDNLVPPYAPETGTRIGAGPYPLRLTASGE